MKKIILLAFIFITVIANAQSNYQRQLFHTAAAGSILEVVYSNEYNTSTFVIKNLNNAAQYTGFAELTKFTTTTGNVTSSKTFSVAGYDLVITAAVKNNQMVYMTARLTNSVTTWPCVIKYNLSTNTTSWRKIISSVIYPFNAIAYDAGANLYLLGSYSNTVTSKTDLVVSKIDTNGVLFWTKNIGESTLTQSTGNIVYNGKRQLYITSVGNDVSGGSQSVILRLDSSGVILNSKTLNTGAFPKFEKNFCAILKGTLVTVDRTINSASFDPGSLFLRRLDTNLTTVITKTLGIGLKLSQVFSNNTNLLLSGQTATNNGYKGFRTIRLDTVLNINASARHYNKINTGPIFGSSSCFINSSNLSFHFFNPFSKDTVFIAKADMFESVACRDSSYSPPPGIIVYVPSTFTFITGVLTTTASNISIPVTTASYSSTSLCTSLTTGLNSISTNEFISVYPNPAISVLTISSENNDIAKFSICDITGKEVVNDTMRNSINISQLQSGIYFIALYDENKQLLGIKKFIKE